MHPQTKMNGPMSVWEPSPWELNQYPSIGPCVFFYSLSFFFLFFFHFFLISSLLLVANMLQQKVSVLTKMAVTNPDLQT